MSKIINIYNKLPTINFEDILKGNYIEAEYTHDCPEYKNSVNKPLLISKNQHFLLKKKGIWTNIYSIGLKNTIRYMKEFDKNE